MKQLPCHQHEGSTYNFFHLQKDKTLLVCEQCCIDLKNIDQLVDYKQLIHIQKALQQPEYLFYQLSSDEIKLILDRLFISFNEKEIYKQLKQFELAIKEFIKQLNNSLQEFIQSINLLKEARLNLQQQLCIIFKFEQFKQFINEFSLMQDGVNPDALKQIEQKINQFFIDLKENHFKNIQTVISDEFLKFRKLCEKELIINNKINHTLEKEQSNFKNLYDSLVEVVLPEFPNLQSTLLKFECYNKIIRTIQEKIKINKTRHRLIYLGSRDGLMIQSFQNKVVYKSNLLMIFKTKSNYIFGGYSPCQWNSSLNNYVQDTQLRSFLFSQTHDQIYPLKDQNSIYCNSGYGPQFGGGPDIRVNFTSEPSINLGHSYQCDQYKNMNSNKKLHLCGQEANIVECEIYELIFE